MAALDLCELNEIKQYLEGMTNVDKYDFILSSIISWVSKRFETYCNRVWDNNEAADITEYFSGEDKTTFVVVRRIPIASVTSLYDDTERLYAAASLIAAADYTFIAEQGIVQLDGSNFSKGINNIKVVYKGGYTVATIPGDLKLACVMQTAFTFKRRDQIGLSSLSGQGGSVSVYQPMELLPEVRAILNGYRFYSL